MSLAEAELRAEGLASLEWPIKWRLVWQSPLAKPAEFFVTPSREYSWQLNFCAIAWASSLQHCVTADYAESAEHEGVACQCDWIGVNAGLKNLLCLFGFWIKVWCGGQGSWRWRECLILRGSHKLGSGSEKLSENKGEGG